MASTMVGTKVSHVLEIAVLKTVGEGLRLLGVERASALVGFLWRRLAPFNRRHARAERHLRFAMPELSAGERAKILGDMWENLGRTAAEALLIRQIVRQPWRFTLDPDVAAAVGSCAGRGILFCSLHQGNWELVAYGARMLGLSIGAVYKRLRNPYSEAYLRAHREAIYDAGLMEAGTASALKLRSLARQGKAVSMLADLPDDTGLMLPFFGHPSRLASFPVAMARRLDLPVIVARCRRLEGARFVIEGGPIDIPRTDDVDADIEEGTRRLHARFEAWIRDDPAQWMWATKKWGKDVPA